MGGRGAAAFLSFVRFLLDPRLLPFVVVVVELQQLIAVT